MFHSETLARVIHADRVRDLERAAEMHRLLADDSSAVSAAPVRQAAPPARRVVAGCDRNEAPAHAKGPTGLAV